MLMSAIPRTVSVSTRSYDLNVFEKAKEAGVGKWCAGDDLFQGWTFPMG
jgi:hypothetical protein